MSAYLVACLTRDEDGKARLLGIDIFSEPSPTLGASRKTAVLIEWPGETFAEAQLGLLRHLADTAPWLLPDRNEGRPTR